MNRAAAGPGRRPWYRISIRLNVLMVLIAIVGAPMGWAARRAGLQRRAVARVLELHGAVVYDWEYGGHPYLTRPGARPPGPDWLRERLGDAYFQEIAQVNLPGRIEFPPELGEGEDALARWTEANRAFRAGLYDPLERDQLACLDRLDRLEALVILGSYPIRGEGLDRLERLGRLKALQVGANLDQAGLDRLPALGGLEMLSLPLLQQGRTDLALLARMPGLRSLVVGGLGATDEHLGWIGRIRRLESLSVTGPLLTDEGLRNLAPLKSLKYLAIQLCPKLTGPGLAHLSGLSALETLTLTRMPMVKAGLDHLRKLPGLKSLIISNGSLDDADLAEFRAARPEVSLSILP